MHTHHAEMKMDNSESSAETNKLVSRVTPTLKITIHNSIVRVLIIVSGTVLKYLKALSVA